MFLIHNLFVFNSVSLLSWKFEQFASLPWNTHFRTKQIHPFEFEFLYFHFVPKVTAFPVWNQFVENSADESLKIKTKQLSAVVCGLISTHLSCILTVHYLNQNILFWVKRGLFVFLARSKCSFIILWVCYYTKNI